MTGPWMCHHQGCRFGTIVPKVGTIRVQLVLRYFLQIFGTILLCLALFGTFRHNQVILYEMSEHAFRSCEYV